MKLLAYGKAIPRCWHLPVKLLLVMKLTAVLMLIAALHVSAAGFAQKITLSRKNAPLGKIFSDIQAKSGLSILYDSKLIRSAGNINIDVKDASLEEVLDKCLEGLSLSYVIMEKMIVIRTKALPANPVQPPQIVSGTVADEKGLPVIGATVYLKELKRGTLTDVQGKFSLPNVPPGKYTLAISSIGYDPREEPVTVADQLVTVQILLKISINNLKELIVVTALGIRKTAKSVTYNVQTISGSEINNVKDPSLVNSLTGKIAGMTVNTSSSGPGGATKVVMRGNKSIYGNNNALYVVDGIPLPDLFTQKVTDGFSVPGGSDGIANINPDDIETITALTGASAAALYGSQAANGVILLTTKKGKAGKTAVNYSFNANFSRPLLLPEFQHTYGAGAAPSFQSWGAKEPANADTKDFFQTGQSYTHAINISTGTERNQTYFSAAAVNATGIIPHNTFDRYNFSARNTSTLLDDKLNLDINVQYISQQQDNAPVQGQYFNSLVGVYLFPRSHDFGSFKNFEKYDPNRNFAVQNWPYGDLGMMLQNPYWVVNRNNNRMKRDRFIASVAAKYTISSSLSLLGRVKQDRVNDQWDAKNYASTVAFLGGVNGRYDNSKTFGRQSYADLILTFNKKMNDLSLNVNAGASIQDVQDNTTGWKNGYLSQFANMFTFANVDFTRFAPYDYNDRMQTQAVFATAQLGYREMLYLEASARNEWSSALAFTESRSYFYPSIGLTGIISEMTQLPQAITFAKVRASYSEVANSIPLYISMPTIPIPNGGAIQAIHARPFQEMKPERTSSFEAGIDLRFFDDQFSISATYYNTHTKNQFFRVEVTPSVGYNAYFINAGNVQNKGIEATAGYNGRIGNVNWNPSLTFALNRNKVVEMLDYTDPFTGQRRTQDEFIVSDFAGYRLIVKKGGSYGDIYVKDVKKDDKGVIVLNDKGLPEVGDYIKAGNANPRYLLGWNNGLTYQRFNLNFLLDARLGGEVVSSTEAIMDNFGVSQRTAEARDRGGVMVNGTMVDAKGYYQNLTGATSSALALYTYSATNIRLREVSLGYKIKNAQLSLVARNLWLIYKKAPYDPEITAFTNNQFQGYDYFGMPSLRNIGVNLKVSF
ncbi:SusC/RagA family TonB-linked outer membrane protein [Chitinophaga sp. SYP-B3965]|uniref:SusC/RagA family TonB-linked outer membrane protein n=1 Tax=Chitinophaga sp. SYP-B3965 TaxID=2663120 RepID=UPI0012998A01|nr:SusC/RagA family TonB-linked outer membrane protein [Chitinophaga sp. SYP-B3965]MRG43987.1 SusC/RagA family TonB-linked outer membrane protein [Chitinophaga sp. SYP-B3965]